MKIGILTNVMNTEVSGQTTYRLASELVNQGHKVWIFSTGNFSYDPDHNVHAYARTVPPGKYASTEDFIAVFQGDGAINKWISVSDLDVLLLRYNPSVQSAWAQSAGIDFARQAIRGGVIALNDPNGLATAMNKMYLQNFPAEIRPRTLITRNRSKIKSFAKSEGKIVLKPLQGSGGKNVFVIDGSSLPNLNQILDVVTRDGYIVAQEYLPAAADGDTRLFLMNGVPLQYKGKYAAFRRIRTGEDMRSNIHAGGKLRRAEVNETMLKIAKSVRPRLVKDGMFLVGLDIVGDKVMEINVFSPGGFGSAQKFEKVDFTQAVIEALQHKVDYMTYYRRNFDNADMAML